MERTADKRVHTTEWEDAQYKYGNRIGKYATHELEILAQRVGDKTEDAALKAYNPHEEKVEEKKERGGYEHVDGDEVLDSDDEDDALAIIRQKRLMELKKLSENQRFGVLRHIAGSDYIPEITDASENNWVVAILIKPGQNDSESLINIMRTVAQKQRMVKFVSIISTEAIPNFPDHHVPCVLLYYHRELKHQLTTLEPWKKGKSLDVNSVESVLSSKGVLERDSEGEN